MIEQLLDLAIVLKDEGINFPTLEFKKKEWSKVIEKYRGTFNSESNNEYHALGFVFRVIED